MLLLLLVVLVVCCRHCQLQLEKLLDEQRHRCPGRCETGTAGQQRGCLLQEHPAAAAAAVDAVRWVPLASWQVAVG